MMKNKNGRGILISTGIKNKIIGNCVRDFINSICHPRAGGDLLPPIQKIPAYAGMTEQKHETHTSHVFGYFR